MRTENIEVHCDQCEADISYHDSAYPQEWIITLAATRKPRRPDYKGEVMFACICYPPLERTYHFCDDKCVAAWFAARAGGTNEPGGEG